MFQHLDYVIHAVFGVAILLFDFVFSGRTAYNETPLSLVDGDGDDIVVCASNLTGQVVVITGSNTGIGKATADKLGRLGATVILSCRDAAKGKDTAAELNSKFNSLSTELYPNAVNGRALYMSLDLSQPATVVSFVDELKSSFKRIDVLINNAGINVGGLLGNGLEQLFQVNYLGHFLLFRLLEGMLTSTEPNDLPYATTILPPPVARVINLSSVMHHFGQPDFVASARSNFSLAEKTKYSYYADSKLYMNLFTMEINRRFDSAFQFQATALTSLSHHLHMSPLSPGNKSNTKSNTSNDSAKRPIVALSVNPGSVRSDIWRHVPCQGIFNMLARRVFLTTEEGCATSVFAATLSLRRLRDYQMSCNIKGDIVQGRYSYGNNITSTCGGALTRPGSFFWFPSWWRRQQSLYNQFLMRADLPYVLPYRMPVPLLAFEMLGGFAGAQFGGVSLPPQDLTTGNVVEVAPGAAAVAGDTDLATGATLPMAYPLAEQLWSFSSDLCSAYLDINNISNNSGMSPNWERNNVIDRALNSGGTMNRNNTTQTPTEAVTPLLQQHHQEQQSDDEVDCMDIDDDAKSAAVKAAAIHISAPPQDKDDSASSTVSNIGDAAAAVGVVVAKYGTSSGSSSSNTNSSKRLWDKLRSVTVTEKEQLRVNIEMQMEGQQLEFDIDGSRLTAVGRAQLDKVIPFLLQHPNAVISIEGHTNCKTDIPQRRNSIGNLVYLQVKPCTSDWCRLVKLSQARVDAVQTYFTTCGCTNEFVAKGWGCTHVEHGAARLVRISPL